MYNTFSSIRKKKIYETKENRAEKRGSEHGAKTSARLQI